MNEQPASTIQEKKDDILLWVFPADNWEAAKKNVVKKSLLLNS